MNHSPLIQSAPDSRNSARFRIFWVGIVVVVFGISSAFTWKYFKDAEKKIRRTLPIYGHLPDFEFTERSGKLFGSKDLRGKVWIADFIFTRCAGPCPGMTLSMSKLQYALQNVPDIKLVSLSADPDYDSPTVLTEYAKQFHANEEQWLFLTGESSSIRRIAREGFKVSAEKVNTNDGPANNGGEIIHSTHFILADAHGNIRGYYNNAESDIVSRLLQDATSLLKEK